MNASYFSPHLGRFMSVDPIGAAPSQTRCHPLCISGAKAAKKLFKTLAGRAADGGFDRVILKKQGLEVVFRESSKTGTAKVEIINFTKETLEKITFLPE
jgi:hypothetical protein